MERPEKYKYVVHAEANGIYNTTRSGVCLGDSICVVTFFSCSSCAKALIQVGISEIITISPDFESVNYGTDFRYSLEMFEEIDIKISYMTEM